MRVAPRRCRSLLSETCHKAWQARGHVHWIPAAIANETSQGRVDDVDVSLTRSFVDDSVFCIGSCMTHTIFQSGGNVIDLDRGHTVDMHCWHVRVVSAPHISTHKKTRVASQRS